MFRWVGIIGSLVTIALFVLTHYAAVAEEGCPDYIPTAATAIARVDATLLSLQPSCTLFYNTLESYAFWSGIGLTVLLLAAHLIEAASRHAWDWFILLLVVPPFCFTCGALAYSSWAGGGVAEMKAIANSTFCMLIGLLNLSFGIIVLKPERRAAGAALPGAEPAPVSPLNETPEQPQP